MGQEFIDTFDLSSWRRQKLAQFWEVSHISQITWISCTLQYCCPLSAQLPTKYPVPTPKYHTYLRGPVPTANGAFAGEIASLLHMKAIAAVAAAAQHHHCRCCLFCCVQPQPQHQQQHYRSSSSSSIAADNMSACSIRPNHCECTTRYAYCTSIRALSTWNN